MYYDLIVVGAGASGLMSAATALKNNKKVLLIDKNEKVGRKLYITGKGRCNVTNNCSVDDCIRSVTRNQRFLYSAFNSFTPQDTMDFFEERGVKLKTERGNRVFPESDKSTDIIDALFHSIKKANFITDTVKEILISENKIVGVKTKKGIYNSDNVIIACGGMSYPGTGSDGNGYKLAESVGHTIVEPEPSLVAINSNDEVCRELQGLALKNTAIKILDNTNKKVIYEDFGEMLFTHFGVSGPMILSASAHLDKKSVSKSTLVIDLKPALTNEMLDKRLQKDLLKYNNKEIKNSLFELLPRSIIPFVIKKSEINPDKKCNELKKIERQRLIEVIKSFKVALDSFRPISEAIITRGGVSVKEINPKTMASKIISGLYFAGEVIDVDAYTGGFNLQIAFSTGFVAGQLN